LPQSFINNLPEGSSNFMCTTVSKDHGGTGCKYVIPNELSDEGNSHITSNMHQRSHQQMEDRADRELQTTDELQVKGFTLEEYQEQRNGEKRSAEAIIDQVVFKNLLKQQQDSQRQVTSNAGNAAASQTNPSQNIASSDDIYSELGVNGLGQILRQNTGKQEALSYINLFNNEQSLTETDNQINNELLTTLPRGANLSPSQQMLLIDKMRVCGNSLKKFESNNTLKYDSNYLQESPSQNGQWPTPEGGVKRTSIIELEGNIHDVDAQNVSQKRMNDFQI